MSIKVESIEVIHPVLLDGHSRTGLGTGEFNMAFDDASGLMLVESKRNGSKSFIPLTNVKRFTPGATPPAPKK